MSSTPFGRCPICTEELELVGDLLICPQEDYVANGESFSARWQKYFKAVEKGGPYFSGIEEAEGLLKDLQEMNIKEINENDSKHRK